MPRCEARFDSAPMWAEVAYSRFILGPIDVRDQSTSQWLLTPGVVREMGILEDLYEPHPRLAKHP